MAIKAKFNSKDLSALNDKIIQDLTARSIRAFQYIGETLIIHAKTNAGFTDRTGNLRSSIGYFLLVDGKLYKDNYVGQAKGIEEGRKLATELSSTLKNEKIALIVTAGMNYALYVEAKGYNVLTGTENYAKSIVNNLLNQLLK